MRTDLRSVPAPNHFTPQSSAPSHTAIIMDGNGRWAAARGLHRSAGHREGARALRRVVEAAPTLGIRTLTLYAFSSDNWNRPRDEVRSLMSLLAVQLRREAAHCGAHNIRMTMIGRRDRLPQRVREAAAEAEAITRNGANLHLRIAVDYSARDAILRASAAATAGSAEAFSQALGEDVDLLIRTGGEQRLSDFLLWECAYAELVFSPRLWPDFGATDLQSAVETFQGRSRRFGRLDHAPAQLQPAMGQSWIGDDARTFCHLRGDRWLR